ncbi:MAG: ABC transporter permease [Clostridiales bacterium]|nr:ABC transporter permease [Clostridiales bacterium]
MSKKKKLAVVVAVILMVVLDYLIFTGYQVSVSEQSVEIHVTLTSDQAQTLQIYYIESEDGADAEYSESMSVTAAYIEENTEQELTFSVPADVTELRFDLGEASAVTVISGMKIVYKDAEIELSSEDLSEVKDSNDIENISFGSDIQIESLSGDPYLIWNADAWNVTQIVEEQNMVRNVLIRVVLCAGLDFVFIILLCFSGILGSIPRELIENRKLIFSLAKNDFKTKFAGSYLGIFWAFVQPIVTVVLYWFVFEKGLKAGGINTREGITVPFVLWLIAGLVPWFFFQDSLNGGANALIEYNYLVKKVVFKISILPVIKVISSLFVHVFFVAFMLVMYVIMGFGIHLPYIQIIYYSFCVFALSLGLSYLTSSIAVFFRDLTQVINIILQVGTWLTPIMWNFDGIGLPSALRFVFELNPMFYVVQGYRSALIDMDWFWNMPVMSCYFWGFVVVCFVIGSVVFRRLQVHFADVL